jgi:AraC-like DNA-binding protein
MSADLLSDVLRTIRLRGAVFYDVRYRGPWAAEAPAGSVVASSVMPGADHVMEYHVVSQGECWAAIVGEPPVRMSPGDVVMFPQGDAHVLSSAPGMRAAPIDLDWVRATAREPKPVRMHAHDGSREAGTREQPGDEWNLVCGFIGCDVKPFNPLIAALPRMLHLPAGRGGAWIAGVLRHAVAESSERRPGREAMLERISEMVFVDAVRRHVDALPEQTSGWLAGMRDRHVGRALAAMHAAPERAWTMERLAAEAALSRSALHERFVDILALPPMQYLAQWRMQVAAGLLRTTDATVASVALDVGYDSEAAFARAFKRLVGMPPAAWRRVHATRAPLGAAA